MTIDLIIFSILAITAVAGALLMILSRNLVHAVLYMVASFAAVAILFLTLNAPFLAAVQVIVYAGAIMVLFLFVVMLLGPQLVPLRETLFGQRAFGVILAALLLVGLGVAMAVNTLTGTPGQVTPEVVAQLGNPQLIGQLLFTNYLFPFEITSILLLVAMVGAVVLVGRRGRPAGAGRRPESGEARPVTDGRRDEQAMLAPLADRARNADR